MKNSISHSSSDGSFGKSKLPFFSRFSRRFVHHRLGSLTTDRLIITEGDRSWEFGSSDNNIENIAKIFVHDSRCYRDCLLYTSPSPRDLSTSRMPSSA